MRGQALLLVVLVMVVALTIGLSIAARSIITLRTTTEEVNSQRALAAAEAGIETALVSTETGTVIADRALDTAATIVKVDVVDVAQNSSFLLNNGMLIPKDEGADIWLSTYTTDPAQLFTTNRWNGTLSISWGDTSGDCNQAALEIVVFSGTRTNPVLTRSIVDPCNTGRAAANKFTTYPAIRRSNDCTVGTFSYSYTLPAITNGLIGRVTPIYTSTRACVTAQLGSSVFPSQGRLITATGQAGGAQRTLQYFQGYDTLPSEFFYALFAP